MEDIIKQIERQSKTAKQFENDVLIPRRRKRIEMMLGKRQKTMAEVLSKKIDDNFTLFFKKQKWCPIFLYKLIGKHFINIERKL